MEKTTTFNVFMCACIGPVGNDPYCPCIMKSKGLTPSNLWTAAKQAELQKALNVFTIPK